ncbi:hypothetical protein ASPACDRAFT_58369 [Aspergillus aculeatus ATCC 16872]|uniref:Uncharacterized protein n=1 Tax=Aspergillus aculeatus (strain ATCC 16872 / CBS 172.66 / WB 5094) TaxID=690307 RepID=A0A1L9X0R4_ASPA1|nr:uncharacterized protein ASPACDRAFT_58369 [Aspergillus aculeatus ATCC 16872]OJK01984.1 hypothetical protein ASPACDRAFT_58369 [Aspergillus aculeatus ATCC 16872]
MRRSQENPSLMSRLQGQILIIPELLARVYADWDADRHSHELDVRANIEEYFLNRWCPDRKKRQQLIKSNSAMLAGYFWSGSAVERFLPLAKFMYWMATIVLSLGRWYTTATALLALLNHALIPYLEIDCGRLANDAKGTQAYRESTLAFLKRTLEPEMLESGSSYDAADHNSGCFDEISPVLRSGTTVESLRRFADSLYECFWQRGFLIETRFAYDVRVPNWIYEDSHMRSMFRETAISCIILRQMAGQLDSLIPLKMLRDPSLSAQDAMNEACADLIQSKRVFQEAESSLSDSDEFRQLSAATKADVRMLLTGCKNMMVGNVKWSIPKIALFGSTYDTVPAPIMSRRGIQEALVLYLFYVIDW